MWEPAEKIPDVRDGLTREERVVVSSTEIAPPVVRSGNRPTGVGSFRLCFRHNKVSGIA